MNDGFGWSVKFYSYLRSLIAVLALVVGGASLAADLSPGALETKLDAPLRLFALHPEDAMRVYPDRVKPSTTMRSPLEKSSAADRLPVLIRLVEAVDNEAALAALAQNGVTIHSQLGPIISAEVPIANIGAVAGLDFVFSIELSRPMPQRLNVSVAATRANTLRSGIAPAWTGLTGKGVIVGVIDDGFDFRHRDFRKADGSTRLLALWDQRAAGTAGAPPAGFTYGGECTPTMIDTAINGTASACTQPSSGGHGTHVGGIAAGNGSGTGNGQAAYRFVGEAPEADILAANSIGPGIAESNTVLDAIVWMKAKATAAAKPLVINLSLGSYFGARDGTSNYEVGLSSAGGTGVIVVAAAGNEGNVPIRASGPLAQGGTLTFDVNVPTASTRVVMEVWYPGSNQYSVTIQGPGLTCVATAPFAAGAAGAGVETPCGLVNAVNGGPFASNDDRQVEVIMTTGASALAEGTWKITFIGTVVGNSPATVSAVTAETAAGMTILAVNGQPLPAVTTQILTDTSSAKRVIGVAAYNTNYNWNTAQGPSSGNPDNGPVGDLAAFSSRGPRRMCSNAVKCPAVMKPEITAPGSIIMSTLAADTPPGKITQSRLEADGAHIGFEGTSMATPHVAGAIALLLQKKATLTPESVKQLLFANIQKTTFTPAVPTYTGADLPPSPNYEWGYGVLDVAKAAGAIGTARVLDIDGNNAYDALTDGLIALRYLFGLTGPALTSGAVGATATRSDPVTIKAYLDSIRTSLDIDNNGSSDALTDGLLLIRFLFGLRGQALIAGAIGPGATRITSAQIEAYITSLMP